MAGLIQRVTKALRQKEEEWYSRRRIRELEAIELMLGSSSERLGTRSYLIWGTDKPSDRLF